MRYPLPRDNRVLAIDPTIKGFAFAVLEGQFKLIDWGTKQVKTNNKNANCRKRIAGLMDYYRPDFVVLEDCFYKNAQRRSRAKRLIRSIAGLAQGKKIRLRLFTREEIRKTFVRTGITKYEIATAIAHYFPQLAPIMPRRLPFYEPEEDRMNVFDAVSFALCFYFRKNNPQ